LNLVRFKGGNYEERRIQESRKNQRKQVYIETCASGFIPRASKEPKVSAKASRTDATGSSRAYSSSTKTRKEYYDFSPTNSHVYLWKR
jgi:hypothetical protein